MTQLVLGSVVKVRSRQYLVEEIIPPAGPQDDTLVRLSCLDDDAQGQALEVLWESELDAEIITPAQWQRVAARGFDSPGRFSAYLHALRWNCVTSTDPRFLQSPWRAGIEVMAYQVEPLRKALLLPRVNLFIADDVGLGKTIEAGLILRELLLRQKVRRVVVAVPPSVVTQWRDELAERFGLTMTVFDRDYVLKCRRDRGYGVNPWQTHNRFIISHALLRDEAYATPLRAWMEQQTPYPGSMLILDEAHNAAPASSSKYAIDSKLTKVVRDLAPHFEHRLFLSATPHNGHSNSFSALLEILDPQRFCRGVPVRTARQLDEVMVRRLKEDLRTAGAGKFPRRNVVQFDLSDLPEDSPELTLPKLLQDYRELREQRLELAKATKTAAAASMLIVTSLQKRLLSSVDAFARTLNVHRSSLAKKSATTEAGDFSLLREAPGADDESADLTEQELQLEEDAQLDMATGLSQLPPTDAQFVRREAELLETMGSIAGKHRHLPDAKVLRLISWIREECLTSGKWGNRRVLIFTEYVDTMSYLRDRLREAFGTLGDVDVRIDTFHGGGASTKKRDELRDAFNEDPTKHKLRILIATDAAREGVNLQNHCSDLFHFDLPWNPSRMEQRNGRIDRKLQRAEVVNCHYFLYRQRSEDRVLQVLVDKSARIHAQLGSLSRVVDEKLSKRLSAGIRRGDIDQQCTDLADESAGDQQAVVEEELEASRERQDALATQLERLRRILDDSKKQLALDDHDLRNSLDESLSLLGAEPLKDLHGGLWQFPEMADVKDAGPGWQETLDSLRQPRKPEERLRDWRRSSPLRPLVFKDVGSLENSTVHLHLEHRVVQRLLARFLSQGFVHDDLSRATVVMTDSPVPRVLLLGRLSIHGRHAARLHDELIQVTAPWVDPLKRKDGLKAYRDTAEAQTLELLEQALAVEKHRKPPAEILKHLAQEAAQDVSELSAELTARSQSAEAAARKALASRAEREARSMRDLLEAQKKRISETVAKSPEQASFEFSEEEKRQLQSERNHQHKRLAALEQELKTEPARILESYEVKTVRVDPVGLVYLWPVTG